MKLKFRLRGPNEFFEVEIEATWRCEVPSLIETSVIARRIIRPWKSFQIKRTLSLSVGFTPVRSAAGSRYWIGSPSNVLAINWILRIPTGCKYLRIARWKHSRQRTRSYYQIEPKTAQFMRLYINFTSLRNRILRFSPLPPLYSFRIRSQQKSEWWKFSPTLNFSSSLRFWS